MKVCIPYIIIFGLLVLAIKLNYGQPISPEDAEIYKLKNGLKPETIIRFDYFLPNQSRFFFESNYNFNKQYYLLNGSYRIYNQLGYQHYFSEKWSYGVSETFKIPYYPGIQSLVTSLNIAHLGKVKTLHFIKELCGEHYYYLQNKNGYKAPAQARLGIGVMLAKAIPLSSSNFWLMVSYRAFLNHDFRDEFTSIYRNRSIDLTRARIDLAYKIKSSLFINIYAIKETERYYVLGGSNAAGNTFPDYRINRITPVLGLAINIVLNSEYEENFLPGLPFRH